MNAVTSRFLALVLALIIGSPACWCCAQPAPQPQKAKHSCCERSSTDENQPAAPAPKDPCPCGSSMIKREMAKAFVDVPPPNLVVVDLVPEFGAVVSLLPAVTQVVPYFYDTGPPHERLPIFLLQHALLM